MDLGWTGYKVQNCSLTATPFRNKVIYSLCVAGRRRPGRRRAAIVAHSSTVLSLAPEEKRAVLNELERVLNSTEFHGSLRCQEFLRYIVERAVQGDTEHLKERNIGMDVFHRLPSYEPSSDAIVRVRATDVRKRLAQFYYHCGSENGVRILLEAGSYVPEFRWVSEEVTAEAPPAEERTEPSIPQCRIWRGWWLGLTMAAVLGAVAFWGQIRVPPTPLHDFWAPTLKSPNPVVICLGQPVVYHLSKRVHERYLKTLPPDRVPGPYVIPLRPGDVDASDILAVPDQYVGAGSMRAAASLSALLAGWKKSVQVRVGNDFSFYDLRNYPAVLGGAFSNEWTMKLSQKMPFVFVKEGGVRGIREKGAQGQLWLLKSLQDNGRTSEDYAVAGRVFDSGTMEPLVFVAGITQYGTQAAGEFIASEESFAEAMEKAPKDWRTRNIQILLHLDVIGKVPGKPTAIAIRTW